MQKNVSPELVGTWLKGWSMSRNLPLPTRFKSGFRVDVGYEKQIARYVFPKLNDDFVQLSNAIDEPWILLKVCASSEQVKKAVAKKWVVQPQGFMMNCFHPMRIPAIELSTDYLLELAEYNSTSHIKIVTKNGELASEGRVVLVDELAVYDRIHTEEKHRRKGLATIVMKQLEKIALSKGFANNFLVATEEGRLMYRSLGWELYSLYTTIVIPA